MVLKHKIVIWIALLLGVTACNSDEFVSHSGNGELIKNETKATIRCIPLEGDKTPGKCIITGKPSAQRVIFARAY